MTDAMREEDRESGSHLAAELSPPAEQLVALARRALGFMSDAQRAEGLVGLREALAKRTRRAAVRRIQGLAAAGLAAAACAAIVVVRLRAPPDLSFRVDGAIAAPSGNGGGAVEAAASDHPVVHFSDGSEVVLDPRARIRVHVMGEHGARVTVDEGHAHVEVVHTPATRWTVGAGPFVVAVTGTAFGIGWAEAERRLDVQLENGSVSVSGPVSDGPIALRAGQWLTVRGSDVLIRDLSTREGLDAATAASGALTPSASGAPAPRAAPEVVPAPVLEHPLQGTHDASRIPRSSPSWAAQLSAGKFDAIVADATTRGLPNAYATSRAADLAALADAARYTRHDDVAESALTAERTRFPGTAYAHVAAFSLGRLSETRGDLRTALSWYEVYLKEAPTGTFASEALGRKMVTVEHLDGRDAAVALAQSYLARFPDGTYAKAAKALALHP